MSGGGGGSGEVASEQKSSNLARMAAMSVPMYECKATGSEAMESSVCTEAPPNPTAKSVMPKLLTAVAASMAGLSPFELTPSDSSHMMLRRVEFLKSSLRPAVRP